MFTDTEILALWAKRKAALEADPERVIAEAIQARIDRVLDSVSVNFVASLAWPILDSRKEEITALIHHRLSVILHELEKEVDAKLITGLREFYEIDRQQAEELSRVIGRRIHEAFTGVANKISRQTF